MSLWIFDTDSLSLLQRGDSRLIERVSKHNPQDIAITIITAEEQLRVRMNVIRKAEQSKKTGLVVGYKRLRDTLADLKH